MSALDGFIEGVKGDKARAVGFSVVADKRAPDEVAEQIKLSDELGVPANVVGAEPELFKRQAAQKRASTALSTAPRLAAWLKDPNNGALAKDDLDNLTWFERNLGAGGRAMGRAARRMSASPDYFRAVEAAIRVQDVGRTFDDFVSEEMAKVGGDAAPAAMRANAIEIARIRFEAVEGLGESDRLALVERGSQALASAQAIMQRVQDIPMSDATTGFRDETLATSENTVIGTLKAFVDDPVRGAAFLAETAAEFLPVLAGATAITLATRQPAAGAAVMAGGSFLTENTTAAMEFLGEQGIDISTPEGAAEVLQNAEIMAQAQERGVTRGLVIALFDAVSGGVAGQTLVKSPAGEIVAQGIAQMALGSGGEAAAQLATDGEIDAREVVIEGLAELVTAPVEVLGVGGRAVMRRAVDAEKGGAAAKLAEIDEVAAASKLKQRSPDKFQEALDAQGDDTIFVPADGLREYFQAKDVTLDDEALGALGIDPNTFEEKVAAGASIEIPLSAYAARVSGTEDAAWFAENVALDEDSMSVSEAAEFNASVSDVMQEAFERAESERLADEEARASDVQVYDQVFSQLRAAGRSPDVAQNEAQVFSAFFRTMAERYGDDALDLARRFGLDIRGPSSASARSRGDLDIQLNTIRAGRAGQKPETLSEFVASNGGIRDEGGDLASIEPRRGVIAETSEQISERSAQPTLEGVPAVGSGVSADEMARRAVDAGFDLEQTPNALFDALARDTASGDVYRVGEEADVALDGLAAELDRLGLDINTLSNDEIAAALDGDEGGQEFSQSGLRKTDTPEFKEWFGGSQVVDDSGEPLVVYHATMPAIASGGDADFDSFLPLSHFGTAQAANDRIYESGMRTERGERILPVYLSIENPVEIEDNAVSHTADGLAVELQGKVGFSDEAVASIQDAPDEIAKMGLLSDALVEAGVDGLFYKNTYEDEGSTSWVAVRPEQVKSTQNRGEFSANDPRILFQAPPGEQLITKSVIEFAKSPDVMPQVGLKVGAKARLWRGINEGSGGNSAEYGEGLYVAASKSEAESYVGEDGRLIEMDRSDLPQNPIRFRDNLDWQMWRQRVAGEMGLRGAREFNPQFPDVSQLIRRLYPEVDGVQISSGKDAIFVNFYGEKIFEQVNRGSIQIPRGGLEQGQTVINLFEGADLSTLLHEGGHYFLEAFTALSGDDSAPGAMREDMATIREFLGVEDGEQFTTEQHEKWARGFEAYLMEGKAPSLALADAFSRFKSWLVRIYRTAAGLNVEITPEIRDVMSRMLASDAEIAEARTELSMEPLFNAQPSGMTDADYGTYSRMARRGTEQAEQKLMEKSLAKVRRETQAWFKAERKAVRSEVEAEVNKRPAHRLIEMFANQQWLGEEGQDVPDFQLDRDTLVDQFGDGVLAELSRSRIGGKRAIYGANGLRPAEAAEFFGFDSPEQMVKVLQNTGKRKDVIETETDRRMIERHGDPLNDGSIEEEALKAVHSSQQMQTSISEARHLAAQLGRGTRTMRAKVYKQRARLMISRMSVREAMKPNVFLRAERKAARKAQDAFAKVATGRGGQGALAEALQAKEQQVLNGYLYSEAQAVEAEIGKVREKMRAYDKKTVRAKLEGGYIEQIDAILSDYDFRVRSPGQVNRSENLKAFVDRMIEDGRESELAIDPRVIERSGKQHYTKLSVDEMRGLVDTIDNIDHMGRFKQRLIDARRKRDLEASVGRVAEQVSKNLGTGKAGKKGVVRSAFNLLFTADTMLVDMDGSDEFGASYDEIKADIDYGQTQEQRMSVEMAEGVDERFAVYSQKEIAAMQKPGIVQGANGHEWSKAEILSVAMNTGNADNMQRLTDQTVHPSRRLTQDQLSALLSTLDKRDWDFVQSMWDMVDSYWPQLSEVEQRRTGVKPRKVEAVPVDTPHGLYKGGYYPIAYDPSLNRKAAKDEQTAWDKFTSAGWGSRAAIANGMTKERENTGGGRTLRFDLAVPVFHMRDTIRMITLSEAVDNAHRVLNSDRVFEAFADAGRSNDLETFNLWLKDVAAGPIYNSDPLNTFSRMIKNNFTLSRLAFNMKTVALQVTGIGQSAAVIGKRNMLKGMLNYRKRPTALAQEVMEKSPFMAERSTTFQKDIYDFANDVKVSSPLASRWQKTKSDLAKAGFAPMIYTQFYAVDMPTWLGAYEAGLSKYQKEEKAIQFADRMVARAQDSGLMADRSGVERGTVSRTTQQSDFVRLFTTLGGYMLKKMNRGYLTTLGAKRDISEADSLTEKAGLAGNAAADLAMLYVFEGAMMGLIYAMMAGDDADEEDLREFITTETGMAIVGGVPFVRDAASAFRGFGGGGVLGSVLEMPANFATQAQQGEMDRAFRRSVSEIVGTATGLPTTATMRAVERMIEPENTSTAEAVFGSNPLTR